MVLGELGESISAALRKVTASRDVDQALLSEMLGEIYDALVANDVEVALADQFRAAVAKEIDLKHLPPGMNRRKVIQKVRPADVAAAAAAAAAAASRAPLPHALRRPSFSSSPSWSAP